MVFLFNLATVTNIVKTAPHNTMLLYTPVQMLQDLFFKCIFDLSIINIFEASFYHGIYRVFYEDDV